MQRRAHGGGSRAVHLVCVGVGVVVVRVAVAGVVGVVIRHGGLHAGEGGDAGSPGAVGGGAVGGGGGGGRTLSLRMSVDTVITRHDARIDTPSPRRRALHILFPKVPQLARLQLASNNANAAAGGGRQRSGHPGPTAPLALALLFPGDGRTVRVLRGHVHSCAREEGRPVRRQPGDHVRVVDRHEPEGGGEPAFVGLVLVLVLRVVGVHRVRVPLLLLLLLVVPAGVSVGVISSGVLLWKYQRLKLPTTATPAHHAYVVRQLPRRSVQRQMRIRRRRRRRGRRTAIVAPQINRFPPQTRTHGVHTMITSTTHPIPTTTTPTPR